MTGSHSSMSAEEIVREWELVIDELERAARTGACYEPPEGLPPLPARLERRARDVLAEVQQRRQDLLAEREAVGGELAALRRSSRGTRRRRAESATSTATSGAHDTRL